MLLRYKFNFLCSVNEFFNLIHNSAKLKKIINERL